MYFFLVMFGPLRNSANVVFIVDPSAFSISYNFFLTEQIQNNSNFRIIHFTRAYRKNETIFAGQKYYFSFYFLAEKLRNVCPPVLFQGVKFIEHFFSSLLLFCCVIVYRPAVIHYQWVMLPYVDLFFIRLNKLFSPVVHTIHNDVAYHGKASSKLMIWGYDRVVRCFDMIFVHSEKSRNYWCDQKNIPPFKTCIVHHGPIPLPSKKSHQLVKRKQILFFGFVRDYKGVHDLITAFRECVNDGLGEWDLIVAGKILESREQLLYFKNDPMLQKKLVFHDEYLSDEQLADLVGESSIIVFPYRSVMASAALMSVLGTKCTILASDLSYFSERIEHSKNGYLFANQNLEDLVVKMKELISDENLRKRLAETWKRDTDMNSEWIESGLKTVEIYHQLTRSNL